LSSGYRLQDDRFENALQHFRGARVPLDLVEEGFCRSAPDPQNRRIENMIAGRKAHLCGPSHGSAGSINFHESQRLLNHRFAPNMAV
jgi:hypothetical protein